MRCSAAALPILCMQNGDPPGLLPPRSGPEKGDLLTAEEVVVEDGEAFIYVADEDAPHESDHGGWIPVSAPPPCLCVVARRQRLDHMGCFSGE